MKEKSQIYNIGIFAHIDAGKTTFVERILYEAGELSSPGSVEDGTTEMDTLPEEISRGISITSSTTQIRYKHKKKTYFINVVDTPGHLDFHSQVDSALLAVDIAILLIDITAGIRSQTEMIAQKLKAKKLPTLIFINKMDRSVNLEPILKDLNRVFPNQKIAPLYRLEKDGRMEYVFEKKEVDEELELPLLDWSEELTEKYFKAKDVKKLVLKGISEGFPTLQFLPVFLGSALYGQGIPEFLHFLTLLSLQPNWLNEPQKAIVFKKQIHSILGKVVYLKTFHAIEKGEILYKGEESFLVNRMYHIIPGGVQELVHVPGGTVIVLEVEQGSETDIKSKTNLFIGNIITHAPEKNFLLGQELTYSREFVIVIEPEREEDREKLAIGLQKLCWEDSGLDFSKNLETGQWELRGMGELHIEVALRRLQSFIGEIFQIKNLRVAKYGICKSLAKKVIFEHSTFEGKWKSGTIHGFLESRSDFDNVVLFDTKVESAVKNSIESAFFEFLTHGWNGIPVLGLQLRISSYDAPEEFNEHTLSLIKVSIISGIKSYIQSNSATIGPTGHFEIVVPQNHVGTVISLLKKRSARVHSLEVIEENKSLLKGEAAAEKLLGFTGALRNMTQGKGSVSIDIAFSFKDYSELSD